MAGLYHVATIVTKEVYMRDLIVAVILVGAVQTFTARAQDTNALKTEIGNFEAQTNTVLVKGFEELGHVYVTSATVTILCKESKDITHGRREYGAALELGGGPEPRQLAIVDEDELDPLASGLDYLAELTYDVTALSAFEADYTTKYGLRFAGYCSRKPGGIRYYLQVCDGRRVELTNDQLKQLAMLVNKAHDAIVTLRQSK